MFLQLPLTHPIPSLSYSGFVRRLSPPAPWLCFVPLSRQEPLALYYPGILVIPLGALNLFLGQAVVDETML